MKLFRPLLILSLPILFVTSCKKNDPAPPLIADAGPSQSIQLPLTTATLTGTATSGGTSSMDFLWTAISGPAIPTIANSNAASTLVGNLVAGTYVFQLQLTNSNGSTAVDTTSISVTSPSIKTLSLQPGAEGIDAGTFLVQSCTPGAPYENVGSSAIPNQAELYVAAWTFSSAGCSTGQYHTLIKFAGLDGLPANATILSAKLSLYGVSTAPASPQGNSYYPGSPYNPSGTNEVLIKRITGIWDESTVSGNTEPAVTSQNQAEIPASTSQWNYNVVDLDVTNLVKDIQATANYGFLLQMKTETYYRSMNFASSDNADATKRPKLVVTYQ